MVAWKKQTDALKKCIGNGKEFGIRKWGFKNGQLGILPIESCGPSVHAIPMAAIPFPRPRVVVWTEEATPANKNDAVPTGIIGHAG